MGVLNALFGHSVEISEKDQSFLNSVLAPNEEILKGFKLLRDMVVFTTKRLILVDKQGFTGKKVGFLSIPYKNISRFSVETAGSIDFDSDIKIWINGVLEPIAIKINKGVDILEFQRLLAQSILG